MTLGVALTVIVYLSAVLKVHVIVLFELVSFNEGEQEYFTSKYPLTSSPP